MPGLSFGRFRVRTTSKPSSVGQRWLSYCSWIAGILSCLGVGLVVQDLQDQRPAMRTDFGIFYAAGRLAISGRLASAYSVSALSHTERLIAGHPLELPFPYPPYVAIALGVFAHLPVSAAFVFWSVLNVAAFLVAVGIALSLAPRDRQALRLLLAGGCLPMAIAVAQGENSGLVALGMALALLSVRNSRAMAPAVLLLALKPQFLLIPLVMMVTRRDGRQLMRAGFTLLAVTILGLAVGGVGSYVAFVKLLIRGFGWSHKYNWGPQHDYTLQALVRGFLSHWLFSTVSWLVLAGLCLALFWTWSTRAARPTPDLWIVASVATVLCTTHVMFHDLAILYAPLVLAVGTRRQWMALLLLVAPWLDPTFYLLAHIHLVTVACFGVFLATVLLQVGSEEAPSRMNGFVRRQGQGNRWRSFVLPRWASASGSGTQ